MTTAPTTRHERIEPAHDTLRSGPLTLHYVDWGGDASTAMVLLHGFSSQARYWDGFAVHARHRHRVYALDQRGHGRSDWAGDYGPDTMPDDVAAFAEHLGLERFVLVGHSMGGLVAMRYAAFHPERLLALVIVDSDGHRLAGPPHSDTQNSVTRALTPSAFRSEAEVFTHYRRLNPGFDPDRAGAALMHNFRTNADGTVTYRFDPQVLPKLLPATEEGRRRNAAALAEQIARSRTVTCPMLLVRGEHSDILSPEQATATAGMFPRGRVVELPGTTHLVPTDDPRAFRSAVFTFLDAALPPPA